MPEGTEPLPGDLRAALERTAARRGRFGEPVVFLPETASTNDVALRMAEHGAPDGATVVALAQTAGRGRLGRAWHSPAGGGLYVSVVCREARAAPMLTLAAGVALADGIRRATGLPVAIKWPNDIVIADGGAPGRQRKLAGILAEGSAGAEGVQYVVIGLGVNVRPAPFPAALAGRATSIEAELGREVDRGAVLAETLAALNEQVGALASGARAAVIARWRALAPGAVGARVEWTDGGTPLRGTTAGIAADGALLVRVLDRTERIVAGDLKWL